MVEENTDRGHARLRAWLLIASVVVGCSEAGAPEAGDAGGVVAAPDAGDGGLLDGGTPNLRDAGLADAGRTDGGEADGGQGGARCEEQTFTYEDARASSVWLTGSFAGWAPNPAAGALPLVPEGAVWRVTLRLPPGIYQYKLIVDGTRWVEDPANPQRTDDGFGGFNSVREVCQGRRFEVLRHRTDASARTFTATVEYGGDADVSSAALSLDGVRAAPGALTVGGRTLQVELGGLADGIHDVRLRVGDDEVLLKAYVNESADWRDALLYFVMTDRFRNGDPRNDAPVADVTHPLGNFLGGDFAGVSAALDEGYFDALGVNAIWLSWPVAASSRSWEGEVDVFDGCDKIGTRRARSSGYHGYWPTGFREIDPRLGTIEELQALVRRAHARGIRVVLDLVANHVHREAEVFTRRPELFNQPPRLCRQGLWDGELREECWFDDFLPDWNFKLAEARSVVIEEAAWLVRAVGADGLRVDALKHMEDEFITELRRRMSLEFEQTGVTFYLVGETFTGDVGLVRRYVGDGWLHGQFDFPSNMSILQGLATDQLGLDAMHRQVRTHKASYGPSAPWMSTFVGNHDIARFVSKASGELPCGPWSGADHHRAHERPPSQPSAEGPYRRLQIALAYAYSVPGIPLLYYGDEVGLAGAGDPDNRRMLPAAASLSAPQRATRSFVERLGQARARHPVLRTGEWTDALWADEQLLVFGRSQGRSRALVVLNRGGARTIAVDVGSLGLSPGTVLEAQLGRGSVSVVGSSVSLDVAATSAEIFVTR